MQGEMEASRNSQAVIKGKFTESEDQMLRFLVETYGQDWKFIGDQMHRRARQVRERYRNYANPKWNHTAWTPEEDEKLKELFPVFGPKWSRMVCYFNGRSDVSIKNRWTCLVNKQVREGKFSSVFGESESSSRRPSEPEVRIPTMTENEPKTTLSTGDDLFPSTSIDSWLDSIFSGI